MSPATVLHRRNAGGLRFGVRPMCGAVGEVPMTTNSKWVTCRKCRKLTAALRAAAKERMAAL